MNRGHYDMILNSVEEFNEWREEHPYSKINLEKADLAKIDLSRAYLLGANLREADLYSVNLNSTNLYSTILCNANLQEATLSRAILSGADMSNVNLQEANLVEAVMVGTDLTGADLHHTNLVGAQIEKANLSNAKYSITNMLFSIQWYYVSDKLTLELMRHEARMIGISNMNSWINGGAYPYENMVRDLRFYQKETLWEPEDTQPRINNLKTLFLELCKEKEITVTI